MVIFDKWVALILVYITPLGCACQDFNEIVRTDVAIFTQLHIKKRSSFSPKEVVPKLISDRNLKGYSGFFNRDYASPKIFVSQEVYDLFMSPNIYSKNIREKYAAPDSIFFLDSIRKLSAVVHEFAHYIEDTAKYNTSNFNENKLCVDGDMFCMIRLPSEFDAYSVGAFFVLKLYKPDLLTSILNSKGDSEQKKIDIINEVYYRIYRDASFKRDFIKGDLVTGGP
jgi:hypothetical protein